MNSGHEERPQKTLRLSAEELSKFRLRGCTGAYSLLDSDDCLKIVTEYTSQKNVFIKVKTSKAASAVNSQRKYWKKSAHAALQRVEQVARHPVIVEKVKSILGEDVLLWGSSVIVRRPGRIHKWHTDREHFWWTGVTVFVGLVGTTPESSLKVVPGSHRYMRSPTKGERIDQDAEVLERAKLYSVDPTVETIGLNEGEFFIFDGPMWHGSNNVSNNTRFALLLQYTSPDYAIRIPLTGDDEGASGQELQTPENFSPPCLLVSGTDSFNQNRLITGNRCD